MIQCGNCARCLFSAPAIVLLTSLMGAISMICFGLGPRRRHTAPRRPVLVAHPAGLRRYTLRKYGIEKSIPNRSYVLVSNHASYMDTRPLSSAVPLQFRFFAKHGLYAIPFLGWHLRRAGHLGGAGRSAGFVKAMSAGAG